MTYRLIYSPKAKQHLQQWAHSGQRKTVLRIQELLRQLQEHPYTGTGKPERLKGDMAGLWSRRIDKKNRLVYGVEEDVVTVEIVSAMGHYQS